MIIIQATFTLVVMLSLLWVLARIAPALGLVDTPSARKLHAAPVPLVGGIAIYITVLLCILAWPSELIGALWASKTFPMATLISCMGFLVGIGVLDDRFDLGVAPRIITEVLIAATIAAVLDLRVINLGNLMGQGDIRLIPFTGYIFTIIAIFGVINAINMLDGLDGLVALTMLSSLLFFQLAFAPAISPAVILISICLGAFTASNLGLIKGLPKTFLGDAGSRLLGLIAACLLLTAASSRVGGEKLIAPATALYIIAVPLFDMVYIVTRRALRHQSPFTPDRNHIHHLLLFLGLPASWALFYIVTLNLLFNGLGLLLHKASVPEYTQFALFCLCFVAYSALSHCLWSRAER